MTHLCTTHPHLCPTCWRCDGCCTCYEDQLTALTDVLARGPQLEPDGTGEWGHTVYRGYARAVLDAGWRPPNVPPTVEHAAPPRGAPTAPVGGTQTPEASDGN